MALFAAAPLLVLYLLTHSSWLKTQLPDSKEMAVLYLIVLPVAWFAVVMGLHAWVAPIRHRLRCTSCRHRLVGPEFKRAVDTGHCPACGNAIAEEGA